MVNEIKNLNDTVMELPAAMDEVFDMSTTLNNSLGPALEQISNAKDQVNVFEKKRDDLNMTKIFEDVESMKLKITNSTEQFNTSEIIGQIEESEKNVDVNFNVSSDLSDLQTKMNDNKLDESAISTTRTYGQFLDNFTSVMETILNDTEWYKDLTLTTAFGVCITAAACDNPTTCG